MGFGWGKLYVTMEWRPCFFRRKIATALKQMGPKQSNCAQTAFLPHKFI